MIWIKIAVIRRATTSSHPFYFYANWNRTPFSPAPCGCRPPRPQPRPKPPTERACNVTLPHPGIANSSAGRLDGRNPQILFRTRHSLVTRNLHPVVQLHFFLHNLQRLATRALSAADRESVRDRDDFALVRRNKQLWMLGVQYCKEDAETKSKGTHVPLHTWMSHAILLRLLGVFI